MFSNGRFRLLSFFESRDVAFDNGFRHARLQPENSRRRLTPLYVPLRIKEDVLPPPRISSGRIRGLPPEMAA